MLSTVVVLVGPDAGAAGRQASTAANVSFEPSGRLPDDLPAAFTTLAAAGEKASRRSGIFTLLDSDPLAPVVAQWSARLQGLAHELELAIGLAGNARLPDYYFVSPTLPPPEVDWYLSHLLRLAPARVMPVELRGPAVLARLGSLSYGTGFPPVAEVAASARTFVPLPAVEPTESAGVSGLVRT